MRCWRCRQHAPLPPPSLGTAKRTKTVGSRLGLQVWGPTQQATRVPNSHAPRLLVMALAMRCPCYWGIVGCHYHPTLDRPTAPCHFGEMFGGVCQRDQSVREGPPYFNGQRDEPWVSATLGWAVGRLGHSRSLWLLFYALHARSWTIRRLWKQPGRAMTRYACRRDSERCANRCGLVDL